METKANYILVGLFTLAVIAGAKGNAAGITLSSSDSTETFTISQTQSGQQSQPLQRGQQPYQQMPKCRFRMVQPPHQTQCLVVSHQLTQGFHKKLWNNILNG